MRYFITGATGFIGGHLAEACVQRGWQVVTIARPSSDTSFLHKIGVTVEPGDLTQRDLLRQLVVDADVVINCAAKVGDWGPLEDYRQVNVEGLRNLLDACKGQALSRFVQLSSLGVYAMKHHHGTDETVPPPKWHPDGYSQSKVEAEQLALHYYRDFGIPVVILRPGFVYGPRDRTVMPGIISGLKHGMLRYPGGGQQALNTIFIGNLVQALLLAVDNPAAVGQTYNLTDGEHVSKRQFIEDIANAMQLPKPWRRPPLWLASLVTKLCDGLARLRGAKTAPAFTRAKLKFMGMNLDFSIAKAKMELGYLPRVPYKDAMAETMAWYKVQAEKMPV